MGKQLSQYLLYSRRYVIGYTAIALALIALLVVAGLFIPGGISGDEMRSVVAANDLSFKHFQPDFVINMPYHLLQRASIELFGVTNFSIKLPSLILGAFTAAGMIVLLRNWFRHNVAIIATVLVITTGQFLFVAQSGTPSIIYIFWSIWLLVAAMMISRGAKHELFWKIALAVIAALSLYTPLSIYILVALTSAMFLHPHLRFIVRRLSKVKLLAAMGLAAIILTPLFYAASLDVSLATRLLGIPAEFPNIFTNLQEIATLYFNFTNPSGGTLMLPVYGMGSMILIVLGFIHLFTTKYTARSYVVSAWAILLLPVLIINPDFTSVTFVPILLLMGMGIHLLLRSWYRLFPRNPYARVVGIIPLSILIIGMTVTGMERYTYGYIYDPRTAVNFSQDLTLVNKELAKPDRGHVSLQVPEKDTSFYIVVAKANKNVEVNKTSEPLENTTYIAARDTGFVAANHELQSIVTTASKNNADRFYIYKPAAK